MKRIISMLACAALVICSCQKDPKPGISFESGNYVMGADEALTVKVVVTEAPSADLTVDFTVSGTATKGSDYELSAESFTIKAGETVGEVTLTPKYNVESDLNINLTLILPTGFEAGKFISTTINLSAKEIINYNFNAAEGKLVGETEITLNLIGTTSGSNFTASSEYRFPITFAEGTTAVPGTNFEVVDNATEFVVAKGAKSATITLKSKNFEDSKTAIIIGIDASAYGDIFEAGVNGTMNVTIIKPLEFADLEGKWAYASTPILDDPDADMWTMGAMLDEAGDGGFNEEMTGIYITGFPTGTENDILEFKTVDGTPSLIPSGNGSILNFFKECDVTALVPTSYSWYNYNPARPLDATTLTLSEADILYSAESDDIKPADIIVNLSEDGNTLDLFITTLSYIPTDFLIGTYTVFSEMWSTMRDFTRQYDLYFTFTRVE